MLTRRRFLFRLLIVGGAVFAFSQIVLLGALGPRPRNRLRTTAWTPGARLVDSEGVPVTRDALAAGGTLVAFPEGHVGSADAQVALFHFVNGDFKPQPGRETWSPRGLRRLLARLHARRAAWWRSTRTSPSAWCARATSPASTCSTAPGSCSGRPAGRCRSCRWPSTTQGYLVAQSDFTEPVGPGFWNEGMS